MPKLTKKGALSVTDAFDRIASLLTENHNDLGIPGVVASDMVQRLDVLADHVERTAGLKRVGANFKPTEIGEEVSGPIKSDSDESFMKGEFTQQENRELRERVESGDLGKKPNLEPQAPQPGKQAGTRTASTTRIANHSASLLRCASELGGGSLTNAAIGLATLASTQCVCNVSDAKLASVAKAMDHVARAISRTNDRGVLSPIFAMAKKAIEEETEEEEVAASKKAEDEPKEEEPKEEGKTASVHGFNLFA